MPKLIWYRREMSPAPKNAWLPVWPICHKKGGWFTTPCWRHRKFSFGTWGLEDRIHTAPELFVFSKWTDFSYSQGAFQPSIHIHIYICIHIHIYIYHYIYIYICIRIYNTAVPIEKCGGDHCKYEIIRGVVAISWNQSAVEEVVTLHFMQWG